MNQIIRVLLVDDEQAHRILEKRALLRSFPSAHVEELDTLSLAKDFLRPPTDPLSLAIIDLNLAGESGLVVVRNLRATPQFHSLPILVTSTSQLESDIAESYAAGANAYIFKSDDPVTFQSNLSAAARYLLR